MAELLRLVARVKRRGWLRRHHVIWTDKRVEELKQLRANGYSASQIAKELGGLSRSAVIGKLFRLGVKPAPHNQQPQSKREYKPRQPKLLRQPKITELTELPPMPAPFSDRKTLMELKPHDCRWPVGDPDKHDFFFCGGPKHKGYSYCAYHVAVAYQPRKPAARPFIPARNRAA